MTEQEIEILKRYLNDNPGRIIWIGTLGDGATALRIELIKYSPVENSWVAWYGPYMRGLKLAFCKFEEFAIAMPLECS